MSRQGLQSNMSRGMAAIFCGNLPSDVREREIEDLFYKVITCMARLWRILNQGCFCGLDRHHSLQSLAISRYLTPSSSQSVCPCSTGASSASTLRHRRDRQLTVS